MTYVQGFIVPVPAANKDAYRDHASQAVPIFKEFGMTRMVEGWEEDFHPGTQTDFHMAVNAEDGEVAMFSWCEYPDKATAESAGEKMMSDPRMEGMTAMPFDGKRMVFAGFEVVIDDATGDATGYVDGFVAPVPAANKDAYFTMARRMSQVFRDHGATRVVETWGEGIPDGKVTDFNRAVQAKEGEAIVFSWVEWPSKDVRGAGWEKVMADARAKPENEAMPFDGKRMIYGGFLPLVDE